MSLRNKVFKGSIILVFFYVLAKILSFLVEMLIASNYGACFETDAYYLAEGIYMAFIPLISIGIWKVFMPEYKRMIVEGKFEDANSFTGSMILVFFLLSILVTAYFVVFPESLISVFAPGYNIHQISYSSKLLRILSFTFIIATASVFPSAILQSRSLFSKSQLKEVLVFIFPLVYLFLFSKDYGLYGLIISSIIGNIFAMLVLYYLVSPYYKFKISHFYRLKNYLGVLKLYPIACLNSILLQLNAVIDKMFSSTLFIGSITVLSYGTKVINLFNGIISTAISVSLFPYFTEMIAKNEITEFRRFFLKCVSMMCALLVPMTFLLCLFSNEIINMLFGYGKFSGAAIKETSNVLFMYSLGLMAMGLSTIVNDIFFIKKQVRVLLYTTIINLLCNIVLDFIFIDRFSVSGLSLATTISLYISIFLKFFFLRKTVSVNRFLIMNFSWIVLSCILSYLSIHVLNHFFFTENSSVFIRLVINVSVFALVYIFIIQFNSFYRDQCKGILMNIVKKI